MPTITLATFECMNCGEHRPVDEAEFTTTDAMGVSGVCSKHYAAERLAKSVKLAPVRCFCGAPASRNNGGLCSKHA